MVPAARFWGQNEQEDSLEDVSNSGGLCLPAQELIWMETSVLRVKPVVPGRFQRFPAVSSGSPHFTGSGISQL